VTQVRVITGFHHPWPNDTGFYVARARGWYREAGLDVAIGPVDYQRGDTLEHLLRYEADFGVFPVTRLLLRRDRNEPLVGIASINHTGLEAIQTICATGIQRPRDLAGRRVAFETTPRGRALLRRLIAHDGGDPDAVIEVDNRGRETIPDMIAAGFADASFGSYWCWDTLLGSYPESERVTWRVDTIGAPAYHSYLLGTQRSLLETNPELVRAFLAATARGYLAAIEEPASALDVIDQAIPYFPRELLARSLALIATSWTHAGHWGELRRELLEPYTEWLAGEGVLSRGDLWVEATRNDFLPRHRSLGTRQPTTALSA